MQRRGYIVHLTRDTDIYIPLRERVNIGRGYQADLFISLHADSNPDPSVSGASVYTLSESGSDKEAAALAKKENQSDVIAGVDLAGENSPVASILIDLAQRDTMNRSTRFALTALGELSNATDILPREPHRSAAFVVLKAPDVPAVLIELGYLSNAHDCGQMGTDRWREGVAQAIADAVERQFSPASPVPGRRRPRLPSDGTPCRRHNLAASSLLWKGAQDTRVCGGGFFSIPGSAWPRSSYSLASRLRPTSIR